jgi:hypothetical protein
MNKETSNMKQTDLIIEQLGGTTSAGIMFSTGATQFTRSTNNNRLPTHASCIGPTRAKPKYVSAQVGVFWTINAWQNPDSNIVMHITLEPDESLSVYLYQLDSPHAITILGEEHDIPATNNAVIPVCERLLAANQLAFQGGLSPLD